MNRITPALALYRQFFKVTQNCKDKHMKFYVRRRIREEYERNRKMDKGDIERLLEEARN